MVRLSDRYLLVPQMKAYDALPVCWVPFLMYFHPPDFNTRVLHTDSRGFRLTCLESGAPLTWETAAKDGCNLMVGASTVFGVGATHDGATLPSRLTQRTGFPWLNFGGRAYSSTQEFLLFSLYRHHFEHVRRILIFSGLADLSLFFLSPDSSEDYGAFFCMSQFLETMNRPDDAERAGRTWRSLLPRFLQGESPAPEAADEGFAAPDLERGKERLLGPLHRNLANWKLFADALGARVDYVLQPFATWLERTATSDEKQIFAILDEAQGGHWPILAKLLTRERYEWFAARVREICAGLAIPFFDMNEALSRHGKRDDWLFVDRAHFTDLGHDVASEILLAEVLR